MDRAPLLRRLVEQGDLAVAVVVLELERGHAVHELVEILELFAAENVEARGNDVRVMQS